MPVALLPQRWLLVADFAQNGPVARFDINKDAFVDEFITSGKYNVGGQSGRFIPFDMAVGPDHWICILPINSNEVWRFNPATGKYGGTLVIDPYPGTKQRARTAWSMMFGPDGALYLGSQSPDPADLGPDVHKFDGQTGAPLGAFVPNRVGGEYGPRSMAFGPDGHFYFCGLDTDSIQRHDGATGAFKDAFVAPKSGGLSSPERLAFAPDGNLCVISGPSTELPPQMRTASADRILLFDGTTGAFLRPFVSPSPQLGSPVAMAFGPDDHLYVASVVTPARVPGVPEYREGRINVFHGITGAHLRTVDRFNIAGLQYPRCMTFAPAAVGFEEPQLVQPVPRWVIALGIGMIAGWMVSNVRRRTMGI